MTATTQERSAERKAERKKDLTGGGPAADQTRDYDEREVARREEGPSPARGVISSRRPRQISLVVAVIVVGTVVLMTVPSAGLAPPGAWAATPLTAAGSPTPNDPGRFQLPPLVFASQNPILSGQYGADVAASGKLIAFGAPGEAGAGLGGAGRVYLVNQSTGQTQVFVSPNASSGAQFGISVAVNAHWLAVGAAFESVGGQAAAGRVYLFDLQHPAAYSFISPYAQPVGLFGTSVSLSGNTLIVGAPGENTSGFPHSGAAYLIGIPGGSTMRLSSPNSVLNGAFGTSVAISSSWVAIGAPGEFASGIAGAGLVYLFSASSGNLIETMQAPSAGVPLTFAAFGTSVAISGSRVAVGAPYEGGNGSVHLFDLSTQTNWTLKSPNSVPIGHFGWSVSLDATTLGVGAPSEHVVGTSQDGRAYTFSATNGGLVVGSFVSPNPHALGDFGFSVALDGASLVVGAPFDNGSGGAPSGNGYLFQDLPLALSYPFSAGSSVGGDTGWSVATDGSWVVVGSRGTTVSEAGSVLIENLRTDSIRVLVSPTSNANDVFGFSVAVSGGTVLVGAPGTIVGGITPGAAFLYDVSNGTLRATLHSPSPTDFGEFGTSVAVQGGIAVVGAPFEPSGPNVSAGNVYTFNASTGASVATLPNPRPQDGGAFGWSVALSGTKLAAGTFAQKVGPNSSAGIAYLYNVGQTTPSAVFTSPNSQSNGDFGFSLALDARNLIVGAPQERAGPAAAGHVYVYPLSALSSVTTLTSPNRVQAGIFGWSVALSTKGLLVGAPGESPLGVGSEGDAYLFSTSSWLPIDRFWSPNPGPLGEFGLAVGGGSLLVVGAPFELQGGVVHEGTAYVV